MPSQPDTQNENENPHTVDSGQTDQDAGPPNTSESSDEIGVEGTPVSELLAVAEQFNAAFNTSLYELESSRKLASERAARIDELNESIKAISNSLQEEASKSREKDEEHARRVEELGHKIHEIEAERDRLQQQAVEQDEEHARRVEELGHRFHEIEAERVRLQQQVVEREAALNAANEETGNLSQRVDELNRSLEQYVTEGLHAKEEFAREKDALTSSLNELQENYAAARDQLDALQREREELSRQHANELEGQQAANDKLAAHAENLQTLNRALHETVNSETDMHKKILEQKDSEIETLRTSLGGGNDMPEGTPGAAEEAEKLQAVLQELESKLAEAEAQRQTLGERATLVDELESEIARLGAALQEAENARQSGTADVQHLQAVNTTALQELESKLAEAEAQRQMLGERAKLVDELESEVARLGAALQEAENTRQSGAADAQHLQAVDTQVADLESALETARAEREELAGKLRDHETLEQEVASLRETVQQANSKLHEQAEASSSVDALQDEVEALKSALAAANENNTLLQDESQDAPASGDTESAEPPATAQNPVAAVTTKDREQFISHLNALLAEPDSAENHHTVMYVLMDNFIRIRDEIGVLNSEKVICEVADIIEHKCSDSDVITRFGDCTFVILTNDADADTSREKAESIRTTVESHIFDVSGHSLITSTSIGICSTRESDDNAETVVARADMACESARTSGGNQVLVNSTVTDDIGTHGHNESHAGIVNDILNDNRIKIYYQPISSLKDMDGHCFEVLTRIVDEDGNIILPGEFFSMAVNSGKAMDVDLHVIENIMRMMSENSDQPMLLFVKLTRQSVASQDFAVWVLEKIKEYKVNPEMLVFEVAESMLQNELKNLSMLSKALHSMGCKVAIEHYRMSTQPQHLQHIHADYLKIDSGLVQNIGSKGKCLEKVKQIVEVARSNNYITIAEGVESPACLSILWELGVSLAQGYFIQAPAGNIDHVVDDTDDEVEEHDGNKATYTLG